MSGDYKMIHEDRLNEVKKVLEKTKTFLSNCDNFCDDEGLDDHVDKAIDILNSETHKTTAKIECSCKKNDKRKNTIWVDENQLGEHVPIKFQTDDDLLSGEMWLTWEEAGKLFNDLKDTFNDDSLPREQVETILISIKKELELLRKDMDDVKDGYRRRTLEGKIFAYSHVERTLHELLGDI